MSTITHETIYSSEYEGYHGGEGFGRKVSVPDSVEYFDVEEGFKEFLNEAFEDGSLNTELFTGFKDLILYSTDIHSGEESELSFPNEYLSEERMKELFKAHLDSFDETRLNDEIVAIENEIKDTKELLNRSEEDEKKAIALMWEVHSVTEPLRTQIYQLNTRRYELEQATDKDDELIKAINDKIMTLEKEKQELTDKTTVPASYAWDSKVKRSYNLRQEERQETLSSLNSILSFIKAYANRKQTKDSNIKRKTVNTI